MKKFRLLLLDANVVIELFRLGIWDQVVGHCDIHLARTVAEAEAQFFETEDGQKQYFDLHPYVESGAVNVFDIKPTDLGAFRAQFDLVYMDMMDDGETESLAYMLNGPRECRVCSADKIIFRVLGGLDRAEQGISLEEILQQIGLGRALAGQFSKAYRETWTQKGFEERMRGIGFKGNAEPS